MSYYAGNVPASGRESRSHSHFIALIMMALILVLVPAMGTQAQAGGVSNKLSSLRSRYPQGKYWNHLVTAYSNNGDQLAARRNESYAGTVTSSPCYTHNGTCPVGRYDCNYFDGGIQCNGFAKKVFYDVFGQRVTSLPRRYDRDNIRVGDYVRISVGGRYDAHSGVVLSISGSTFTLVECNFNETNGACRIKWGTIRYSKSCINYYMRATNYDSINKTASSSSSSTKNVKITWSNISSTVKANDARIYMRANANVSGRFTAASGTVWDATGKKVICKKTESASTTGTRMAVWYDIQKEMGKSLKSGTKYIWQLSVTFNGRTYYSPKKAFTTRTVKVTSVKIASSATVRRYRTYRFEYIVKPANATNRKLKWVSSNTSLATVTQSGILRVRGRKGVVYITAMSTDGSRIYSRCRLTIR